MVQRLMREWEGSWKGYSIYHCKDLILALQSFCIYILEGYSLDWIKMNMTKIGEHDHKIENDEC